MLNTRMIARSIVATTAAAALAFTTVGVAQADDHSSTSFLPRHLCRLESPSAWTSSPTRASPVTAG